MKNLQRSLRVLCLGAATVLGGGGARAQITFPVNPFEAITGNRANQPAGEGVAEGRYLAMELEARLLADPVMGGSQPTLELGANGWVLKGQFNNQAGRVRAREIVTDATGQAPQDKSRVVIYPTAAPKPLSPAAARVMAQRLIREKFPGLMQSVRCESETPGVVQVAGTALSVEDKLELLRALHRQKGVVAVENEVVLGPMVRNGRRVILVSQNGDLALEKLPVSFKPGGETEEQPATAPPAPEKKPEPVADEKVPPLPADFPPPPALTPAPTREPAFGKPAVVPAPVLSNTPRDNQVGDNSFIARAHPEESTAAEPTGIVTVNARNAGAPRRPWRAPSAVQVGGQPIATLQDLNETTGTQWATAHAPTRMRAEESAWQYRVRGGTTSQAEKVVAKSQPAPAIPARAVAVNPVSATQPPAAQTSVVTVVQPAKVPTTDAVSIARPVQVTTAIPTVAEPVPPVIPVKGTLKIDGDEAPATPLGPKGKPSLAHLEAAVRIACAGLVQKVEIVDQGGISLIRVTASDVASERKALEALVLLPEIHHPEVKLEVKLSR